MPDLRSLLAELLSGDEARAEAAVPELIALGAAALPALREAGRSEDADQRWWVVRALAGIAETDAQELATFLKDPQVEVRQAAALGLASHPSESTLPELIARMTVKPLQVLGRPGGTLAPGADADVTVFDPEGRWAVRASEFASKGRSTPFDGWELGGRILLTVLGGEVTYRAEPSVATVR